MQPISNTLINKIWTITEAKARLSELLRLATKQPQFIGTKKTYVLITRQQWEEMSQPKEPIGQYLIDSMSGIGELELPSRKEPKREIPFQ